MQDWDAGPEGPIDPGDTDPSSSSAWHVAAKWELGDSWIWLGSDTDGTDSPCGTVIPSSGITSSFSSDADASGVLGDSLANWCMKIDWD